MRRRKPRHPTEAPNGPQQLAIAVTQGLWTGLHSFRPSTMNVGFVEVDGQHFAVIEVRTTNALPVAKLTPSEQQVLTLLVAGKTSSEIATARSVAERTVINQISSIYRKLNVSGRAELTALASSQS
jgi:DNA-binding NarL/FixJ family response regulator